MNTIENKKKKNILVITKSPWIETSALGNTFSNFFGEWYDANILNIYCREELPHNNICSYYYNITEMQLAKNMFSPYKIGKEISKQEIYDKRKLEKYGKTLLRERKMLKYFRSNRAVIFLLAREMLWKLSGWKNKKLDRFLEQNQIDVIFAAIADPIYLQNIIDYCNRKTNAKLVLFFSDDVYSYKSLSPIRSLYKYVLRSSIKKLTNHAAKLYGASKKLCDEYEQYFGKQIEPLYKGCFFGENFVKKNVCFPIKLVYAGNLYYGRWKILEVLAQEIAKINIGTIKMTLEIFTTTPVTAKLHQALNNGQSSRIMGSLAYEQIKTVLSSADIVLHVESFDPKQIKTTRLSFSTKIIDCMQSCSCMMAIGPRNVASIEYLKNIKGALVITELSRIGVEVRDLVENPSQIITKARQLNSFAYKHHNIETMRYKLKKDFADMGLYLKGRK